MAKPETTAGNGETSPPPSPGNGETSPPPSPGNGWMPTNFKAVKGLRNGEVVEVTNDPSDPADIYGGEHNLMSWSQWGYWRRYVSSATARLVEPHPIAEAVDHPKHYNAHPSGIECIDVVRHMNFNCGNAVKYIWRAGEKDPTKTLEDLRKAVWYLNDEIERLSK